MTIAASRSEANSPSNNSEDQKQDFPSTAPAANPVFYRTYSRKTPIGRESWSEVSERNLKGLSELGSLNEEELKLMARMQAEKKALPSGR